MLQAAQRSQYEDPMWPLPAFAQRRDFRTPGLFDHCPHPARGAAKRPVGFQLCVGAESDLEGSVESAPAALLNAVPEGRPGDAG